MRRFLIWTFVLAVVAALGAGVWILRNIAASGQFSTLRSQPADCKAVSGLTGVEDLVIDPVSGFVYFSATDRRAQRSGKPLASSGIYLGVYDRPEITPQPLTANAGPDFHPHGVSLFTAPDGTQTLAVVNHPSADRSEIVLFDVLTETPNGGAPVVSLRRRETITDPLMPSANDVHLTGPSQFYASVDQGSTTALGGMLEVWLNLPRSSVVYWDGAKMTRAAGGLVYANGINGSADGRILYVAETTGLALRFYERDLASGVLTRLDSLHLGTALDNIDVAEDGTLWIAAHPHILDFLAHVSDPAALSPTQILKVVPPKGAQKGEVRQVYMNDGSEISAGSVAAAHRGRLLVGSVFESRYLNCVAPQ
jgi:arylesterase/paraoxonase